MPDAKQMVEVIGEFRETQRKRLEASQEMIVPYVIRAFLDGADPRELATLCGYVDEPQEVSAESSFAQEMRSIMGGDLFGYGRSKPDALTLFTHWITNELSKLITEAAKNA